MTGTGTRTAPARLTPLPVIGGLRAHRLLERNYLVAKRVWTVFFSGLFEPIFYLFSLGIGMGALVNTVTGPGGSEIAYVFFVAPSLLAASAMNGAVIESTFNIFFKLKFGKVYDGILTTPMKPVDIAVGEIGWCLLRGAMYSATFLVVLLVMGYTSGWLWPLALPAAILIGFAFASCGMAATTYMNSWQDFDLVQMVTLPLFLFSGTFFPIEDLPEFLQLVVALSPLYHGAELVRGLVLGVLDITMIGHVGYLVAVGLIGVAITRRRLVKLLLT